MKGEGGFPPHSYITSSESCQQRIKISLRLMVRKEREFSSQAQAHFSSACVRGLWALFEMILWKQIASLVVFKKDAVDDIHRKETRKETFYVHKNSSKSVAFISSPTFFCYALESTFCIRRRNFLNRESPFPLHPFGVTKMNLVDRKTLPPTF